MCLAFCTLYVERGATPALHLRGGGGAGGGGGECRLRFTWTPAVGKIMALMAVIKGLGPLSYSCLGFR